MEAKDAVSYLRRYQAWRRGVDERTMDEAGLTPAATGEALDGLLAAYAVMESDRNHYRALYKKALVMRERLHAQERRRAAAAARAADGGGGC